MTKNNTSPAGPNARPERADARLGRDAVKGDDAAAPANRGGEVILIPKHLRMEWTDVLALDPELPPSAFKVACVIGSHFNHRSGDTYVSQEAIADLMRLSLRTVQAAIGELERRGYLIVGRRELGKRESDGRRVCGGRGVANTYAPALDGQQVAATNAGRRLASRAEEAWQERTQRAASSKRRKDATGCVLPGDERTQSGVGKDAMGCVPTLSNPSDYNPTRGSAGAKRNAPAHPLGYAAELLERRLGAGQFKSWFAEVRLVGASDGTLTLSTVSRFNASWLATNAVLAVEECWNKANPAQQVHRVEFVVVKPGDQR